MQAETPDSREAIRLAPSLIPIPPLRKRGDKQIKIVAMGNFLGSCFARTNATAGRSSSAATAGAAAVPPSFFSPHSDAINCVVATDSDSFLSCSDDKSVALINAFGGYSVKRWDVGYAVQRCWWGSHQLSLAADRGGHVTWLVDRDGTCQIGGTGSHKLTVNALAGDMQQVCIVYQLLFDAKPCNIYYWQGMALTGSRDAVVKFWSLSTQQVNSRHHICLLQHLML